MAIGTPYAVGSTATSATTTNAPTWTNNTSAVAAGDTLLLFYSGRLNAEFTITSIGVSGGLSLSPELYQADNNTQNGESVMIRVFSPAGGIPLNTVFTFNLSASPTRHSISGIGVPGIEDATPDAAHKAQPAGGTNTAPSATTGTCAAGEMAFSQVAHVGGGASGETGTPTSGWTEQQDGPVAGASTPFLHQYVERLSLTSSGSVTSSPTFASNSGGRWIQVVVFRPAATGSSFTATVNDSATPSDATSFLQNKSVPDSVTPSDATTFSRGVAIADAATVADNVGLGRVVLVADPVALDDSVAFDRGVVAADAVALADSVALDRLMVIADVPVSLDDLAQTSHPLIVNVDDATGVADVVTFDRGLRIADAVTPSDAVAFDRVWLIGDAVTPSDAQSFQRGVTVSDAANLADSTSFVIGVSVAVADAASTADAVLPIEVAARAFADAVALTDAVSVLPTVGGAPPSDLLNLSAIVRIGAKAKVVL